MCACFGKTTMSGWGKQNSSFKNEHSNSISNNNNNNNNNVNINNNNNINNNYNNNNNNVQRNGMLHIAATTQQNRKMQFMPLHQVGSSSRYKPKSRFITTAKESAVAAASANQHQLPPNFAATATAASATANLNAFAACNLNCQTSSASLNSGLQKNLHLPPPPQQRLTLSGAAATVAASSISLEQLLHRFSLGLNLPNNVFTQTILGAFPFLANYVAPPANVATAVNSASGVSNLGNTFATHNSNAASSNSSVSGGMNPPPTLTLCNLLQIQAAYNALLAQTQAQQQQIQQYKIQLQQQQQQQQQEKQMQQQQQQLQNLLDIEASKLHEALSNHEATTTSTTAAAAAISPSNCLVDFINQCQHQAKSTNVTNTTTTNSFALNPLSYICANCGTGGGCATDNLNVVSPTPTNPATPLCFDLLRTTSSTAAAAANTACYCASTNFNNAAAAATCSSSTHQYQHVAAAAAAAAAAAFSTANITELPSTTSSSAVFAATNNNNAQGTVSKFQLVPCSPPALLNQQQQPIDNNTAFKPTKIATTHANGMLLSNTTNGAPTPTDAAAAVLTTNEFSLPYPIEYRGTVYYSLRPPVPVPTITAASATTIAASASDKIMRANVDSSDDLAALHVKGLTRRVFFNGREYVFDGGRYLTPPADRQMYLMISDETYNRLPLKECETCAAVSTESPPFIESENFTEDSDDDNNDADDGHFLNRSSYPTSPPPRPPALYGFRAHMLAAQKQEAERQSKCQQLPPATQPQQLETTSNSVAAICNGGDVNGSGFFASTVTNLEEFSRSSPAVLANTQTALDCCDTEAAAAAAASANFATPINCSDDDQTKQQRSYSLNLLKTMRQEGNNSDTVNAGIVPKQILKSIDTMSNNGTQNAPKLHVSQSTPFSAHPLLRSTLKAARFTISQPSLSRSNNANHQKTKSDFMPLKIFNPIVSTERVKKLEDHHSTTSRGSLYKEYSYGKLPKYGFKAADTSNQQNSLSSSSRTFNALVRRQESATTTNTATTTTTTVHENSYGKLSKYSFRTKTTTNAGILRTQLTVQTTNTQAIQTKSTDALSKQFQSCNVGNITRLPEPLLPPNYNISDVQLQRTLELSSRRCSAMKLEKEITTSFSGCLFVNEFANVPKTTTTTTTTMKTEPTPTPKLTSQLASPTTVPPPPPPLLRSEDHTTKQSCNEQVPGELLTNSKNSNNEEISKNCNTTTNAKSTIISGNNNNNNNNKTSVASFCGAAGDAADINSFLQAKAEATILAMAPPHTDEEAYDYSVHYNHHHHQSIGRLQIDSSGGGSDMQLLTARHENASAEKVAAEERARRSVIDAPTEEWPPLPKPRANNSKTSMNTTAAKSTPAIFVTRQQQQQQQQQQHPQQQHIECGHAATLLARQAPSPTKVKLVKKQLQVRKKGTADHHVTKQTVPCACKSSTATSTKLSKTNFYKQNGGTCYNTAQSGGSAGRSNKSTNYKNCKSKKLF